MEKTEMSPHLKESSGCSFFFFINELKLNLQFTQKIPKASKSKVSWRLVSFRLPLDDIARTNWLEDLEIS